MEGESGEQVGDSGEQVGGLWQRKLSPEKSEKGRY